MKVRMIDRNNRKITDPDLLNAEAALKRAAKRALEIGLKNNTPVYIWRDGKIYDLTQDYKDKK
jgi:hypothetical protein